MSRRDRRLKARKLLSDEPIAKSDRIHPALRFIDRHYYKLQIIPLLILILSIGYITAFTMQNGDFVRKGVSLAGGTSVTVSTTETVDTTHIEKILIDRFAGSDVSVRILRSGATQTGFVVDAANIAESTAESETSLVTALKEIYPTAAMSVETTGPTLGESFFRQTFIAVIAAFILMAIVVFITFRTFYPSVAVILAGFSTVVSTLAVFNLMGMQLSTAGVASFLMLIGYSIDTDILLSTRVLRQRDQPFIANVWSAMKTGLTMQITTMIAVTVVLIFSNNPVFSQIMTIVLIGMVFDAIYTWIQNGAILKWYVDRTEDKQ